MWVIARREQTLRMLRLLEEREYQAANLARARSGGGRSGTSRQLMRDDLGMPIQVTHPKSPHHHRRLLPCKVFHHTLT